jgi:hypothetical protein
MRDIVLFLVFGAYLWAAAVVAFISLYVYRATASYAWSLATKTRAPVSNGCNQETPI